MTLPYFKDFTVFGKSYTFSIHKGAYPTKFIGCRRTVLFRGFAIYTYQYNMMFGWRL